MKNSAASLGLIFTVFGASSAVADPAAGACEPGAVWSDDTQPDPRNPRWLARPTGEDILLAFPERARRNGISGRAVIACHVDERGRMSNCRIVSETPPSMGFGEAAIRLSRRFRTQTHTDCGRPTLGIQVTIPVSLLHPGR